MASALDVEVVGVDGEVVIHRDEWGIPHVRARSAHDAFLGQGFVQAQDRLGQLEYDRRRAAGRWAEVAGREAVAFDVFARRCGLARAARRECDALSTEARDVLDAFAAGVNAYLALGETMPVDLRLANVSPEPWEPWHCCAVFLVRHVVFATWQRKLWRGRLAAALGTEVVARLQAADSRVVPLIVPPGASCAPEPVDATGLEDVLVAMEALGGTVAGAARDESVASASDGGGASNAWAIHGRRTASGLPLVAGDPHRVVEVPGVYYQCHLACDEFDAVGLAFVGVPGLAHFGHSERVAWCVTNANGDYQDLYVERFAPGDPTRYEFRGEWRAATVHREVVDVRDGDRVDLDCYETHHGPVVFGDPASGAAIALRTTALAEPSSGLAALLPILRARDVDALDRAVRTWVDPVNNLLSADRDGNVSYRTTGRIPVRSRSNAWGPVPGWSGEHEWLGFVPDEELPRTRNPETGVVVTANQRVVGPEYPHYLGMDVAPPDRAARLHERLRGLDAATADDMAGIHRDRRSTASEVWIERLVALEPDDPYEQAALEVLRRWDRDVDADDPGAAVSMAVRDATCRIVAHEPGLAGLRAPLVDEPSSAFQPPEARLWPALTWLLAADDRVVLGERSFEELLAAALAQGVAVLRTASGDDPSAWRWGSLHRCAPTHPLCVAHPEWAASLDPPPVEVGGELDTVNMAAHEVGHGFRVTSSSVARYVFDLADWERSGWIVPLGSSGDPVSVHFADQQSRWADGELVPMRYEWDAIESTCVSTTRLRPKT